MITLKVKNWTSGLSYISRITEAKRQSQRIKCQFKKYRFSYNSFYWFIARSMILSLLLCYLEASTSFTECIVQRQKSQVDMTVLTFNLQVARLAFQMSQFQSVAGQMTAVEPLLMRALELKVGDSFLVSTCI